MIEILDEKLIDWRVGNQITDIEKFIEHYHIPYIYLDVDGVLIHSCQAVCDMINSKMNTHFTGDQILSWNFKEICPSLTDKDVEELFADESFFERVRWIQGAYKFILRHANYITIVTKGSDNNIIKKEQFFKDWGLDNVEVIGLPLDYSKSIINMSLGLFIDDCTKNLNESNAKYKIQFIEYDDGMNENREWIKGWDGLKMTSWG